MSDCVEKNGCIGQCQMGTPWIPDTVYKSQTKLRPVWGLKLKFQPQAELVWLQKTFERWGQYPLETLFGLALAEHLVWYSSLLGERAFWCIGIFPYLSTMQLSILSFSPPSLSTSGIWMLLVTFLIQTKRNRDIKNSCQRVATLLMDREQARKSLEDAAAS